MTWDKHRETMVEHLLYLRSKDQSYARWAMDQYLTMPGCPVPDLAQDVTRRWRLLSRSEHSRSDGDGSKQQTG
jgi:hypothetical protein